MYQLFYSPNALEDLENIKSNISVSYGVDTARIILKKMTTGIRRLEQSPNSGQNLSRIIDAQTEYWYLFTEKNYVFYLIEENSVRVVRVLNEKQNFMQILFEISVCSDDEIE